MKIRLSELRQIIKEEIDCCINEADIDCDDRQKNKPFRAKSGSKQMAVCAKDGDKERLIRFGDTNSRIGKSNPKRRKSFRARHNCSNADDKLSARHWSCKEW